MNLELNLSDEPKSSNEAYAARPMHWRPWVPHMRRPPRPFFMWSDYFPYYMPHFLRFPHQTYWDFQGYSPFFARGKVPWGMNPYRVRNVQYFPEYQFDDKHFSLLHRPFSPGAPELFHQQARLLENVAQSKTTINSEKDHHIHHEKDRKTVNSSEGSTESLKFDKGNQKYVPQSINGKNLGVGTNQGGLKLNSTVKGGEATNYPNSSEGSTESLKFDKGNQKYVPQSIKGKKLGVGTNQDGLKLNSTVKGDEAANYPKYASKFNMGHFWSSSKREREKLTNSLVSPFVFSKLQKGNAIFRDLNKGYKGFEVGDVSASYARRKEQKKHERKDKEEHTIVSGLGDLKIRYNRHIPTI